MKFLPIDRMWERIERSRSDSDTALFQDLLLLGEMLLKTTVAGLVAGIEEDVDRHRYGQLHKIIRADGLGEWCPVLDEVITGPSANHLVQEATTFSRELNQKVGAPTWQYQCCALLDRCVRTLVPNRESLPLKVQGKRWFVDFVELRNKTKGHGATTARLASNLAPQLESAIRLFCDNFPLFKASWAFLHQNLSGKYRVSTLVDDSTPFKTLSSRASSPLSDGIYIYLDQPRRVELMHSDLDVSDFYFPNGAFDGKRYELLSYISGDKVYADPAPYLAPPQPLPPSLTQGLPNLDIQGKGFGNVPPAPSDLIQRASLEEELQRLLLDDRHPIITLHGQGGIGKTSLALRALNAIQENSPFFLRLWFSARDIELLPEGPKPVQPHVLTIEDIAREFTRLVTPAEAKDKTFKPLNFLQRYLSQATNDGATIFVFDNFETVRNLVDVYAFLDTNIRLPNKALITTRKSEFKGDYPIQVLGMNDEEGQQLIEIVARSLGITKLLTDNYRQELLSESAGHPYIIKILLGEVAKANRVAKVNRVVASQEHVLTALFERTYQALSLAAKRVFLTLSNWRSMVALLGLKAVLLRPSNEKMDVDSALEELRRSSMIEFVSSGNEGEVFLDLSLSASEFGRQKVRVDPMKAAVEADCEILRAFGPTQETDLRHGLKPRVEQLFRFVFDRASKNREAMVEYRPVLEFVANSYPLGWLLLAELYEDIGGASEYGEEYEEIKRAILNYIQHAASIASQRTEAWRRLGIVAHRAHDVLTEIHANVEMCQDPNIPFWEVSDAANRVNARLRGGYAEVQREERQILAGKLVTVLERRKDEATADDFSRLAWLCLHLKDVVKARQYTQEGLRKEPSNEHCRNLAQKRELQ